MAYLECKTTKEHIKVRNESGIYWLGLNNPDRKNALSKEMLMRLRQILKELSQDKTVRVLVIYGENGFFSSGADLEWMRSAKRQTIQENEEDAHLFFSLYETLYHFPAPVITWVQKFAFGGAIGLVACSDIGVADKDARFAFPEVKLGLTPATIAPFVLKKIGLANAQSFLLTGAIFSAKKAKKAGLVTHVVKPNESKDKVVEIAQQLLQNGPESLADTKHLLHRVVDNGVINDELGRYCGRMIASSRASAEGQEGVNAFFGKRAPQWTKDN